MLEAKFQWSHARDLKPEPEELTRSRKSSSPGCRRTPPRRPMPSSQEAGRRRLIALRCAQLVARRTGPAKVNLTLRVIGRRPDGYHDIESLVVFAGVGDRVDASRPARALALDVRGRPRRPRATSPTISCSRRRARSPAHRRHQARALRACRSGCRSRPGSAAARRTPPRRLRLLARANRLALDDPRLMEAARATGADVPVCLDPRPRLMRGIGDMLSEPLDLPRLPAVLVNPGVAVPTKDVFAALRLATARNARASIDLRRQSQRDARRAARGCWRRAQRSRSAGDLACCR